MKATMPLGKVDPEALRKRVLGRLPQQGHRVVVGPAIGEDVAIIDLGGLNDSYMIVSSDPISGAEIDIGRYAVHVNANDVATAGARPSLFVANLMMARSSSERDLDLVASQIAEECAGLGISVIGGHTEVSPIERTIVSSTMIGFVQKSRLARRPARKGDVLVLTKGAGIEGTSIISRAMEEKLTACLGRELIQRAQSFSDRISVVPEAMIAAEHDVRRMHDPTEGGIIGGLMEMCVANRMSALVRVEDIPIPKETHKICDNLGIDPLLLISSGSLLCLFDEESAPDAIKSIEAGGIPCAQIGSIQNTGRSRLCLERGARRTIVREFPCDELWRLFT